jgi:hypothetical protein
MYVSHYVNFLTEILRIFTIKYGNNFVSSCLKGDPSVVGFDFNNIVKLLVN